MTTFTRREFDRIGGLSLVSLLVSGWTACGDKLGDLIGNLSGILNAVEAALTALSLLQNLLPESVNTAAKYLIAVAQFVSDVDGLLLDETASAVDKSRQILNWASGIVMPIIPNPIGGILMAVSSAVDKFLSYFGTDAAHAGTAARTKTDKVPKLEPLSPEQKAQLDKMKTQAATDQQAIKDWQAKATIVPHTEPAPPPKNNKKKPQQQPPQH